MKAKFFDIAKRLSNKSTYCHKLGAVVVKKDKAIGFGYNQPNRTHPRSTNPFHTVHAELDAILGLSFEELKGATIYVYREHKNGEPAMAKPCKHCQELIRLSGIIKIYYTGNGTYEEEQVQ